MNFYENFYPEKEIRENIKKYPEKLTSRFWYDLSFLQNLSEDFIREFQDKVDWVYISKWQNLSEEFLIEFIEKIDITNLNRNGNIPEEVKQRITNLKKVIDQ